MDDDIETRLRARESDTNCWQCGEYGCLPADCNHWTRKPAPCVCAEHRRPPSHDGWVCACNCHEPSPLMLEAADEIERLRAELDSVEKARIALLKLLTEFYETCSEEQHSVEMLCLHRAAGHLIANEEIRRD